SQELIGSRDPEAAQVPKSVTRVLVNGEPITAPAGRADDFAWPRRGVAPVGADPIVATTTAPIPVMKPAPETTVAAPNAAAVAAGGAPKKPTAPKPTVPAQAARPNSFFSFFR